MPHLAQVNNAGLNARKLALCFCALALIPCFSAQSTVANDISEGTPVPTPSQSLPSANRKLPDDATSVTHEYSDWVERDFEAPVEPAVFDDPGYVFQQPASVPKYAGGSYWNDPASDWGYMARVPIWPLGNGVWVRADYTLGWVPDSFTLPLVTTAPDDTDPDVAGVLGEDATSIVFGNGHLDSGVRSGLRLGLGFWLTPQRTWGVESTYHALASESDTFRTSSAHLPVLARPFFDAEAGVRDAMLVAHPDFLEGSIGIEAETEFHSVDILFRRVLFRCCHYEWDALIGYRFARFDDSLYVGQFSEWTEAQGPIVVGTTREAFDYFDAESDFHGVELGFAYREQVGRWSLEMLGKVALGNSDSEILIAGATTNTVPGAGSADYVGGLLAQQTNIGRYSVSDTAVIPEFDITVGYQLTPRLYASFGYTFIYWGRVARATDQIDYSLSQLPPEDPTGDEHPHVLLTTSDFWLHGLNFGLECRF